MSEPFVGQIALMAFDYAPRGWSLCNGALLPIQQNAALYSLLGTQFGGDAKTTFALPDLRGRIATGSGISPVDSSVHFKIAQSTGAETIALTSTNFPSHNHVAYASTTATSVDPTNAFWGGDTTGTVAMYGIPSTSPTNPNPSVNLSPAAISTAGGSQGHQNMPPFVVLNYVIALSGIFPMRS